MSDELESTLNRAGISYKLTGGQALLKRCFLCGGDEVLYVRFQGTEQPGSWPWRCCKCGESGGRKDLLFHLGFDGGSNVRKVASAMKPQKVEHKTVNSPMPLAPRVHAMNAALLSAVDRVLDGKPRDYYADRVAHYLLFDRKISRESIEMYSVGSAEKRIGSESHDCVVFPFFDDDGNPIKLKYRGIKPNEKGKRAFLQEGKEKASFFGLNTLEPLRKTVVICEGEMDALTISAYGYANVLSPANGAGSWDRNWNEKLAPYSLIHVAYDNDKAGKDGADKVSKALGTIRCRKVVWPDGFNDANELRQSGYSVEQIDEVFAGAQRFDGITIYSSAELYQKLSAMRSDPDKLFGHSFGYQQMDALLAGIRGGESTYTTGETGQGKTTFTQSWNFKFCASTMQPTMIMNFEMKPEKTSAKIISQIAGKAFVELSDDEFERAFRIFSSFPIYFVGHFQKMTVKELFDFFAEAAMYLGIFLFVVDPLQRALEFDEKNIRFVFMDYSSSSKNFAEEYDTHVHTIIHPKNDQNPTFNRRVHIYHIPESAAIRQDADWIVSWWSEQNEDKSFTGRCDLTVLKAREDFARKGRAEFMFDPDTYTYTETQRLVQDDQSHNNW